MAQETNRLCGGITRRSALKTGVAVTSGLTFSGATVGTVGAEDMSAMARAVPIHIDVRAMGDSEPSPVPDPQDKLVHRFGGNPIDDGTDHEVLDGTHQLRWGEYGALEGRAKMECVDDNGDKKTKVSVKVGGLVPGGLYTIWVCEFEGDGAEEFVDERDFSVAIQNLVGCNPLGKNDGTENVFRATGGVGTLEVTDMPGPYTVPPTSESSPRCLLNTDQILLAGVLHLDDQSHGPLPGDLQDGDYVDHFGFIF